MFQRPGQGKKNTTDSNVGLQVLCSGWLCDSVCQRSSFSYFILYAVSLRMGSRTSHVLRVNANTHIYSLCVCCEQYQQHHFQGQHIPSPNGRPQSSPHSIVTALRGRTQSSPGLYAGDLRGRTNSPGQFPVQVNITTDRQRESDRKNAHTKSHTHTNTLVLMLNRCRFYSSMYLHVWLAVYATCLYVSMELRGIHFIFLCLK